MVLHPLKTSRYACPLLDVISADRSREREGRKLAVVEEEIADIFQAYLLVGHGIGIGVRGIRNEEGGPFGKPYIRPVTVSDAPAGLSQHDLCVHMSTRG